VLVGACAPGIAAAQTAHDIHFLSEHVVESGMDAHYAALPWPAAQLDAGAWRSSVDVSAASTRTDFIHLDGSMVAFGATHGIGRDRGYELLGFYSDMDIAGAGGRGELAAGFLRGVPLDLPNPADFGPPRGTLTHFGAGAAYVAKLGRGAELIAGMLLERVDARNFEMDYRLVDGADAGAAGVLEYRSAATFLTPLVSWQRTLALSPRWTWSPRALLTYPLPPGDLDSRLSGPGFDLATPQNGSAIPLGDPFVALGLALAHVPSGVEIDLGGAVLFAATEHVSHAGVDRAVVLHVAWRPPRGGR
jgi:hypothetical protein